MHFPILYEQFGLDAWKPTILFYASLVNPTHLIRAAIHAKATDLAYQIFRDTPKPLNLSTAELQELEALKSTVQTLFQRSFLHKNSLLAAQAKIAGSSTSRKPTS